MKSILTILFLTTQFLLAQSRAPEGIGQGYDGEWTHVSQQLLALDEATPAEKFAWRPAAGVRARREVYMHIVTANYYLLGVGGVKPPADCDEKLEKTVTAKPEVSAWLRRSREFIKCSHASDSPKDLQRTV